MKKQFIATAALLLLSPLAASAGLIGSGSLSISQNGTSSVGVTFTEIGAVTAYLDYQASSTIVNNFIPAVGYQSLSLDTIEVYCVEGTYLASPQVYNFYTGNDIYGSTTWEEVTWLANKGLGSDDFKNEAQKSLWEFIANADVYSFEYASSSLKTLFSSAADRGSYVDQWLVAKADNYTVDGRLYAQDFLVKATATPVPEPATMLLFGTGLAGLAAVARRRRN